MASPRRGRRNGRSPREPRADVAIAGLSLFVASPVLALAALAIKLSDGGPVLYRQTRVGRDGVDFELFKLRTMVVGAETMGAGLRSTAATRASHEPAGCCGSSRSTSCRSSGMSSAGR